MMNEEPGPSRRAEALLRSLLRPADRESISGDLLEEYRAVRRPTLGVRRAHIWYFRHVVSVLWHLIRPCALALVGVNLLRVLLGVVGPGALGNDPASFVGLMARGLWYGSVVPVPGVSALDALIYVWAGYHGFHRTRLVGTAVLAAGATSVVGSTMLFTTLAIGMPGLLLAPLSKPFVFVILATMLLIALGYGALMGAIGAFAAKWTVPDAPPRPTVTTS